MQMVEKMSYNPAQILHLKKGTLEEAFASVNSARNFLYACYSFMPESSDHNGEPQFNGASDEVCITSQWATTWHYSKVANIGSQTAADPIYNYWSYFYQIRSLTLWDFERGTKLEVDFEEVIK